MNWLDCAWKCSKPSPILCGFSKAERERSWPCESLNRAKISLRCTVNRSKMASSSRRLSPAGARHSTEGDNYGSVATIQEYLKLVPALRQSPQGYLWSSYDREADVLYINFKKPSHATDSELTDDDVIIRYENDEIIGLTVLHASKR